MKTVAVLDPSPTSSPADKPRIQSVARAAEILRAVAMREGGMSRRDISAATGLSAQTTYHLLHTLTRCGLTAKNANGRYVLGLRVGSLAEGFNRQLGGAAEISEIVQRAANETGEAAYAVRWIEHDVVSVEMARGHRAIQAVQLPRGFSSDAHARAGGKVLLAYTTDEGRRAYFAKHELTQRTANTITSIAALEQQFHQIRAQGYASEHEEFAEGLCCIAIPLDEGLSPYAIGVSVPRERYEANVDSYLRALREAVRSSSGE
jgi:IclR family acetate operon transcriptional repressor